MDLQEGETRENAEMETVNEAEKKEENPSPRCVLEIPISGTDSDNGSVSGATTTITGTISSPDSSASTDSTCFTDKLVSDPKADPNASQWKSMFDVLKKKSVRRFSVIPLLSNYDLMSKKTLKRKLNRVEHPTDVIIDWEGIPFTKPSWRNFDISELEAATDNFSSANLIGEGGHAQVYKGELCDGQVVAVKKIIKAEKEEEEKVGDFLSELGIIAHINHHNAAKLLGFSIDGGLHLVLEYLPNGSLASSLHGGGDCMEWNKRFKVAVGVAEGLRYLHLDCQRRVIHRDIKASNILLTQDYEAQITDFGLAKWLPENWLQHIVFPIEGTFGYLAPEYFMHGIVNEKTDVFAYGVLLLEIVTGRRAVDNSRQNLVMWAKPLLDENNPEALVDPRLQGLYDPVELKRALLTASVCIQHLPSMRPHMDGVVKLLKGAELPSELRQSSKAGRTMILDACEMQDYTCSSYMDDLNRHMQLVMDV
ncbi:receptor-like cytosolic serine/threonine-protein kinase RBK1 [Euphorbia lathyris]|uniref:receptor-like cytosolic serine/threonine-protein kinase RBK1 n=1 Tax=Euphorbia lathyris TaxID=212925 RepID=UPI0033143D96